MGVSGGEQIDVVMRKEARDGEGNVMPEDELRDEMFLCELSPCFLSARSRRRRVADLAFHRFAVLPLAMFAGQETVSTHPIHA